MKSVTVRYAKTHFPRIVERVRAGEEVTIVKAGQPVARLVPIKDVLKPVAIGGLGGVTVPDDFNTMFETEVEGLFGIANPNGA